MEEKIRQNSKDINILKTACSTYERDLAVMQEQISEIKTDVKEIKDNQKEYMQTMKEFMEKIERTKANKWVENFLLWAGGIIGTAMLLGLVTLIYRLVIYMELK